MSQFNHDKSPVTLIPSLQYWLILIPQDLMNNNFLIYSWGLLINFSLDLHLGYLQAD